jgi:hypothetical protein
MSIKNSENIYDISIYSDEELYNLLDLNNPTDRELEAKIIFMIKKYNNMQNKSGDKLTKFFTDIYNHFFDNDEEYEYNNDNNNDNIIEGFDNNTEIINPPSINTAKINTTTTITDGLQDTDINKIVENQSVKNIGYIKTLDYTPDQLNPLLNQTIKRLISIDSQFRNDKKTLTTEFTFNLSPTSLKDVVSIKLYSIQIPNTWYTLNKSYGSNFFYLKGNTPGILNNLNQFMKFDILPGNYSPQEFITTINNSIKNKSLTDYTDVSFGNTNLSYNSYTSLATITFDIKKQYNENSYYLFFENFTTPYDDPNRNNSIPAFLGFNNQSYYLNILNSSYLEFYNSDNINNDDLMSNYKLTNNNNYFTIIKYIPNIDVNTNKVNRFDLSNSYIDIAFNITLSLTLDKYYNRTQIFSDLSNELYKCKYLNSESYIKRINVSDTDGMNNIYDPNFNNSFFELKIKPNRKTTQNLTNSKIAIIFPVENDISYNIWTNSNSCFKFDNSINELNIITGKYPITKETTYYKTDNPEINLTCNNSYFESSLNNSKIIVNISNYKVDEFIVALNNGIKIADASANFPFIGAPPRITKMNSNPELEYSHSSLDKNDVFNLFLKINKIFDNNMYILDFTDTFLGNTEYGLGFNNSKTIETINIKGYFENSKLFVTNGTMPKVDINKLQIELLFDNIYGIIYSPIFLSKKDENYSNDNINKNWIIPDTYSKYKITENTNEISTKIFGVDDKKIDISLNIIDISLNSFNVINNSINYTNSSFILPSDISTIYFDDKKYKINGTYLNNENYLTINGNSWNITSSSFSVINSNWNIIGNTFLTNDTSWNIYNNNFTVENNNPTNNLELSGNSLIISNTNAFDISGTTNDKISLVDMKYDNSWNLNANDISFNNGNFNINTYDLNMNEVTNVSVKDNIISIYDISINIPNTDNNTSITITLNDISPPISYIYEFDSTNNTNEVIVGNIYIKANISFTTNISPNNYSLNNFLFSSKSFNFKNYDNIQKAKIEKKSNTGLDISYNNWKVNGNILLIDNNNYWTINGKNIVVNNNSFQIQESSINLPASKLFVKNNLYLNDTCFNIISKNFFTDSSFVTIQKLGSTNNTISKDSTYFIKENDFSNNDTYIEDTNTYKIKSFSGFDLSNQLLNITETKQISLSGENFYVNYNSLKKNYEISANLLKVYSDTSINVIGDPIIFVGKNYKKINLTKNISLGTVSNPIDFSINIHYTNSYCNLKNTKSNSIYKQVYKITENTKILKIYPRFPKTNQVFGNENDISYNIISDTSVDIYNYKELQNYITNKITSYIDFNGDKIFSGSTFFTSVTADGIGIDCSLNILIKKQLRNKDYDISFVDNYIDKSTSIPYNSWRDTFFIDLNGNNQLVKYQNESDKQNNTVTIKGLHPVDNFKILFTENVNNILTFIAYEDGTKPNDIKITIPLIDNLGNNIVYTVNVLINTLNILLSNTKNNNNYFNAYGSYFTEIIIDGVSYIEFVSNINLIYTSQNYNIVFYDTISFIECYVGATSVRNTTWDTTI